MYFLYFLCILQLIYKDVMKMTLNQFLLSLFKPFLEMKKPAFLLNFLLKSHCITLGWSGKLFPGPL